MCNFAGSKEGEYWSFPLPPISPCVASLTSLSSSADVQDLKSQVEVLDIGIFLPTISLLCMQLLHVYVPNGWIAWIVLRLLISAVQARTVKNGLLLSSRREKSPFLKLISDLSCLSTQNEERVSKDKLLEYEKNIIMCSDVCLVTSCHYDYATQTNIQYLIDGHY